MKRGGRLPAESAKRKAERPARAAVRERTLARAGYECQAALLVPEIECGGPLDVDEIRSRGVNPGGHLDDSNTQALCRAHHMWRTANPEEAWRHGLRRKAWETTPPVEEPATNPDLEPLQGIDVEALQRLPNHVARRGTVDWMCKAIIMNGSRYFGLAAMLADGIEIPADAIASACAPDPKLDGPDAEPFDLDTCFCCVDAELILTRLGATYQEDEIGDLRVT